MIVDVMDLEIYRESLKLLKELFKFLTKLPFSEYNIRQQCKRAGESIPALIAEGYAKKSSEKEFKRFLTMALGSSDEIVSHMRVVAISVPKLENNAQVVMMKYKTLSKKINKLISVWKKY